MFFESPMYVASLKDVNIFSSTSNVIILNKMTLIFQTRSHFTQIKTVKIRKQK